MEYHFDSHLVNGDSLIQKISIQFCNLRPTLMKSQNEFFPRSLALLPNLDFFNPGGDGDGGGGSPPVTDYDTVDFKMISSSDANPGMITNFAELKMESPADGGTTPISAENETERVMLIMGLPKPAADWTMTLQLNGPMGNDAVSMLRISGVYATLRATLVTSSNLTFEVSGMFFTIRLENGTYETYLNINHDEEVVRLRYAQMQTFDWFRVSFLAFSNA
jgi:hypothetical protein